MHVISTIRDYRAWRRSLPSSKRIGFVPTMGALHAGHLSHLAYLRDHVDIIVASIFVNPSQFNENADYTNYPRDLQADQERLAAEGCDLLFAPDEHEIYPDGHSTIVSVEGVTARYEGAHRPGHFNGVTTIVCKLLNIVQPDLMTLGEKDAQQLAVIRHMIADLNLDVGIHAIPTVRDADGLALSSRNVRLSAEERIEALTLFQALQAARTTLQSEGSVDDARSAMRAEVSGAIDLDYCDIVDDREFTPAQSADTSIRAIIAGRIGTTRLIDNLLLNSSN